MKNTGRFVMSGLMLSAVSLILRTVGVAFNAKITACIGAAGTGLFSLISSVCAPAVTLSSAGVNLAVSRIIAEEYGKGNGNAAGKVLTKCIIYCLIVSCSVGLILFSFSDFIAAEWIEDLSAAKLIRILAVGLPFITVSSATGGYFVAVRRVSKNAVLQLCEQMLRVCITLIAMEQAIPSGTTACLTAVIVCSVTADGLSCIASIIICKIDVYTHRTGIEKNPAALTRRILSITLPVSVSSFLRSGLVSIEHILIPKGLKKRGENFSSAMASYGTLSGMAMPIVLFPASFLYSFTGLLIPEFAESKEKKDFFAIKHTAEKTLRTVLIFSIGAAGIMLGFSYNIGMSVYNSEDAAAYIAVMAPLIPVMYLDTAVDSILKGLGEQVWTMKINVADALISVFAVWILVPKLGLNGYILLMFASEIFNFSFSIYRLTSITGVGGSLIKDSILPLISVFGAVASVRLLGHLTLAVIDSAVISAIVSILLAAAFYFAFLAIFGVIDVNNIISKIKNAVSCRIKT